MILTLTANPSVDRTIEVTEIGRGSVNRALGNRVDAGGKGVNVARALARHGLKATALFPSGGAEGHQLEALLAAAGPGLDLLGVRVGGPTRANVTVVEADGTTTKLNEAGPLLATSELAALARILVDVASDAEWVVLSGSLPPGAPVGWYGELVALLRGSGAKVAIDTSGPALVAAIVEGPDLIKPNREELAEIIGAPLLDLDSVVEAAEDLRGAGVGAVLVSLGADGGVLVTDAGVWHATAPTLEPRSTVGAGDAMLAGYLAADSRAVEGAAALVQAVAWGSAAASLPGSRMPGPSDISTAGIEVSELARLAMPYPTDGNSPESTSARPVPSSARVSE